MTVRCEITAWNARPSPGTMARFEGADRLAADRARATAETVEPVRTEFRELEVAGRVVRAGSVSEALVESRPGPT
ncbi:hypothetical protein ACF1BP_35665 [Streptomyces sp. NPDC014735]|uniref:hypothetical protein n=2 Tax=Streptomyces TaxID=1883 RepID=UPI0036F6C132